MRFVLFFLLLTVVVSVRAADSPVPEDWAYKPIATHKVPATKAKVRTTIDAFLLAKLEAKGLAFAPPAEKATLLRRVTIDLIGLPPTPEELEAFSKDESPDSYEKVVKRLLASPRFGERAAQMWLDLARYAESDGFKADDPRPNAWRYRDYVIQSLNADKPFDQFIREQIAGDELSPNDPVALVATGFLRHYPDEYNAVNLEQRRQEILNDITDTTASAILGLTMGCAKCHDHKTDPIPQVDYYRLQAFFAGFFPKDVPVAAPEKKAEVEAQRKEWEEKTVALRTEMAKLEEPHRNKEMAKARSRFPEEYAKILDIPLAKRTPLELQIGLMIDRQVKKDKMDFAKSMKGAEKEKWDVLNKQMSEMEKQKPPTLPAAMTMGEVGPTPPETKLLKRGDWKKPDGEELKPGFLSSLTNNGDATFTAKETSSGRRLALAEWMVAKNNGLTPRVFANRVWQQLFGRGIVATANDFGTTGDRPTHPELLDWLAQDFVNNKWSVKHLYESIVLSDAYRQGSRGSEKGLTANPENTLLWQMPRKRMDGETIRDAMLQTAGLLNLKAGGPPVYPVLPTGVKSNEWKVTTGLAERNRRSIYVGVRRNMRYPMFMLFDAPDRSEICGKRFQTTTAPQALMLLNDASILDIAETFAKRVSAKANSDTALAIDLAFVYALGRGPTTEEKATLANYSKKHPGKPADVIVDICHTLLNLNEYLYVD